MVEVWKFRCKIESNRYCFEGLPTAASALLRANFVPQEASFFKRLKC
jgi:hypothetical protein